MIYTNDETDKSIRKRNFLLLVYILPAVVTLSCCGLVYLATATNTFSDGDAIYGYFLSLMPFPFLLKFNKASWLKMPDGTYHHVKTSSVTPINANEPSIYEAEYFQATQTKLTAVFVGLMSLGIAVWLWYNNNTKIVLVPYFTAVWGVFLLYRGIKGFIDKSAKLKLAKTGLWTKKLGFIDYRDIEDARVFEDTSGKNPQLILEIYLRGTMYAEAGQPDERMNLTSLSEKENIEPVLINLMQQRKGHVA